ncbi:MAG: hypothetical protein KDA68_07980, partial [Planctomycetaceae bacterium]|nr:hypothetical protein [Planctomycetaceae bacterium]
MDLDLKYADRKLDIDELGLKMYSYQVESICANIKQTAVRYYLYDERENAVYWGKKLVEAVLEYFFGEWRRKFGDPTIEIPDVRPSNREHLAKGGGNWLDKYRFGSAFASALGMWSELQTMSAFPNLERNRDKIEGKDVFLHYAVAGVLMGGPGDASCLERIEIVEEGSTKWHKIVIKTMMALVHKDTEAAQAGFSEYFKYYYRNQKSRDEFDFHLALEGTLLYHFAKKQGVELGVDDKALDHMIVFGANDDE